MTVLDQYMARIPGSMPFKAFMAGMICCTALAIPVFFSPTAESRQGHDYFSQERPEAVLAGQERARQQYLQEREVRRQALAAAARKQDEKA